MTTKKDLSDFDKGQIVIVRRLGKSVSETAELLGCSRAEVVSTYQQWCEEGQTTNRRQGVVRPRPKAGSRKDTTAPELNSSSHTGLATQPHTASMEDVEGNGKVDEHETDLPGCKDSDQQEEHITDDGDTTVALASDQRERSPCALQLERQVEEPDMPPTASSPDRQDDDTREEFTI